MSEENASYVGNQAEPASSNLAAFGSPADLKTAHLRSPSSDGVSIDDQYDDESTSSGDEVDDETAESDLKPYIFSSDGIRRSFVVQQITRANSSHRPSFTFVGYVAEYNAGNRTERNSSVGNLSSRHHRDGTQTARGGQSSRCRIVVIATNLSLNITYEPPSPKFHQQHPDSSSYRLKLSEGNDFKYSVRGLPQRVKVHQNAYVVRWGPLELQYSSKQQLDVFASSIKHVQLEWELCGQTTRQTAATLRSGHSAAALAPSEPKAQARPSQRSSFASPLPISGAKASDATPGLSRHSGKQAANVPVNVNASKDNSVPSSFWKGHWGWVSLGVVIVAAVTYSMFAADVPQAQPARTVRGQEYKLHIVD